jgi:hypothetical protein
MIDVLAPVIAGGLVAGLVLALLALGQRLVAWLTPVGPEGDYRLPPLYGATGLLAGGFSGLVLTFGALGGMSPAHPDFPPWLGLVVVFGGAAVYLITAAAVWRLQVRPEGLRLRNEFGVDSGLAAWGEIRRVRIGRFNFVFERDGRAPVLVSLGAPGVARAIRLAHDAGAEVEDLLALSARRA